MMKLASFFVALFSAVLAQDSITLECINNDLIASVPDASQFSILKAVVEYAGLDVSALLGDQPFTLLAPNDDAFIASLEVLGVGALTDISPSFVAQVLLNHVILGAAVPASAIIEADGLEDVESALEGLRKLDASTLEGDLKALVEGIQDDCTSGLLDADVEDGSVVFSTELNEATVVTADIMVCTGIIHEIDTVLLPSCTVGQDDIIMPPTPTPFVEPAMPPVYGIYEPL